MSVQLSSVKQTASKWFRRMLWGLVGIFLLFCLGYYAYSTMSYSTGYKSGQLVKISQRGVLFKTYEGTLNLSPNGIMTPWDFSVDNSEVSGRLEQMDGKMIKVHYVQRYKVFFWQGDSDYIVDDVSPIQ